MKKAVNRKRPAVNKIYYIYVGILAVLFFIFHTIPFLKGVFYSFTDWRGYGDWNFVGLRNYLHMFVDADTGNAYIFTFKFAVITTILVNVISLVLACALNAKIKFKNTIKAFYFLPYMLGSLIVGFIFNYIFANLVPELGKALGIKALSVNILGTNNAMWGIIAVSLWIGCAFNTLIYIAGLSYKIIGGAALIAIPLAIIFLSIVVQPDQKLIQDYQRNRIMSFLYPENEEYADDIEQQNNSKTAIASGELVGRAFSNDTSVTSVNDGNFVSENQTDFIFAVAGEQYGFIGCTLIVVLLFLITFECIRMSLRAKDLAGKIICCGVGSIVSIQSFINICVATGLAPNTGTPLPFVSYGLTSLISLFIGMGLVLNVGLQSSAYNKELQKKEQKKDAYFRKEEYL